MKILKYLDFLNETITVNVKINDKSYSLKDIETTDQEEWVRKACKNLNDRIARNKLFLNKKDDQIIAQSIIELLIENKIDKTFAKYITKRLTENTAIAIKKEIYDFININGYVYEIEVKERNNLNLYADYINKLYNYFKNNYTNHVEILIRVYIEIYKLLNLL